MTQFIIDLLDIPFISDISLLIGPNSSIEGYYVSSVECAQFLESLCMVEPEMIRDMSLPNGLHICEEQSFLGEAFIRRFETVLLEGAFKPLSGSELLFEFFSHHFGVWPALEQG